MWQLSQYNLTKLFWMKLKTTSTSRAITQKKTKRTFGQPSVKTSCDNCAWALSWGSLRPQQGPVLPRQHFSVPDFGVTKTSLCSSLFFSPTSTFPEARVRPNIKYILSKYLSNGWMNGKSFQNSHVDLERCPEQWQQGWMTVPWKEQLGSSPFFSLSTREYTLRV